MTHPDRESTLRAALDRAQRDIRTLLAARLEGRELTWQEGVLLLGARGPDLVDLEAVRAAADFLREQAVGDRVTYVINRNINFTNVCIKNCKFCAFSRELRSEEAYFLSTEEVLRRAQEALDLGATEVCLQAGLAPDADGRIYIDLCRALRRALPGLHLHAFSPEEIRYGALRARIPVAAYLAELKDAGLGSLPGTSAEILDDEVRDRISPGRITTAQWIEIITGAHALGLPTTATMMFGHLETAADQARHMELLRSIQADTGGFTEFVPLSFVHSEAPLFVRQTPGVRPGATMDEITAVFAVSRLMLGSRIPNLQASWVKEGPLGAARLLTCGANDLGGTLMNESISNSAGAPHGQLMTPAALRRLIRGAGRTPAQRDTCYRVLRSFEPGTSAQDDDAREPLNQIGDAGAAFGSYDALTRDGRFRYRFER